MKYPFKDLFKKTVDGRLMPIRPIRLGNNILGPGIIFAKGHPFSGVDIFDFLGMDIEAEERDDILTIKGYYKRNKRG